MDGVALATLDDVASYLRANPGSGVRMNPTLGSGYPKWSKISVNIYVDGAKL